MSTVAISTPFNISLDFEIAEFHKRLGAYFIDLVIQVVYMIAIQYLFIELFQYDKTGYGGVYVFFVAIPVLLYHLVMEVFNNGQSIGKMAMGIRVMSLEGGEPNIGQYLMRWIFRAFEWVPVLWFFRYGSDRYDVYMVPLVQAFYTGIMGLVVVLTIAINKRSQRLGDMAAGTTVVNTRVKLGLTDTIFKEVAVKDYKVSFPDVMRLSDRDINAIKAVLNQSRKSGRYDTAHRVSYKVKEVLKIDSNLEVTDFLEKLLEDYNYLATKE
ncbi:MAG: RDD family protein [Chitinophagaceae bacterium]